VHGSRSDGAGDDVVVRQSVAEQATASLYAGDRASQALGMRIVAVAPGRATLVMRIRADMLNGHAICHGGFVFALADSAFAFACNSHDRNTVAAGAIVDFLAPAREGDELTAEAIEVSRSRRSGIYDVTVTNQHGKRVAMFRGRAHEIGGSVIQRESRP
jgi:acyl-CoA thioesterase